MKRTKIIRLTLALLATFVGLLMIGLGYGSPLGSHLTNRVVSYLGFGFFLGGVRWLVTIVKTEG